MSLTHSLMLGLIYIYIYILSANLKHKLVTMVRAYYSERRGSISWKALSRPKLFGCSLKRHSHEKRTASLRLSIGLQGLTLPGTNCLSGISINICEAVLLLMYSGTSE